MYTETMIIIPANKKVAAYLKTEGYTVEAEKDNKLSIATAKYGIRGSQ